MLQLPIFISKKGTRVVRSMDLYRALELPTAQYSVLLRKWLRDVYDFQDGGIRKPENMRDFARRKTGEPLVEDYYLTLELAKQICLQSSSKHKLKYARYLKAVMRKEGSDQRNALRQMQSLLHLVKALSKVSNQICCERRHAEVYKRRHGGRFDGWWNYRKKLLGIDKAKLRRKAQTKGDKDQAKTNLSLRNFLLHEDPTELIRVGIVDWFMAHGKNPDYALAMAQLGKDLALLLKVKVEDDCQPKWKEQHSLFAGAVQGDLWPLAG